MQKILLSVVQVFENKPRTNSNTEQNRLIKAPDSFWKYSLVEQCKLMDNMWYNKRPLYMQMQIFIQTEKA